MLIEIKDLSINYNTNEVVKNISLQVDAGQWILLSGPSGCGKSTLARAITGIIPHAINANISGSIKINGKDIKHKALSELSQLIGIVFQNPGSQLFHLNVEDEISFGVRNLGYSENEVIRRTDWAIEAVGLRHLRESNPAELSGGQKQCVAIAAVLAMRPSILVLDEPSASLDLPNTYKVMETLKILRDQFGITIIMIEHRLSAFMQSVDRVLLMDDGEIVHDGNVEEIFSHNEVCSDLGIRRPADMPMTPWEKLIHPNGFSNSLEKPLLELEQVFAGWNGTDVLKGISFSVYPGDFLAVVGANGVGKSTLAMVAAGMLKPRLGKVRFLNVRKPKPGLDVALLFQNASDQLFTDTVNDEISFGPLNYSCYNEKVHFSTLKNVDLDEIKNQRPTLLSVGQQQRTALGACLSLRPRLIILDEPTLGQDWKHLQQLMDFLKKLNQEGSAVLLISHDYKIVHRYANRLMLMENGRIKIMGKLQNKREEINDEV